MALTLTMEMTGAGVRPMKTIASNDIKLVLGRVEFDYSYASGGESLVAADLNLHELLSIVFAPATNTALGTAESPMVLPVGYNFTDSAVVVFSGDSELASGADLTGLTARFIAIGF